MYPDNHLLKTLYQRLLDTYGPQQWWPADSPFEIMIGAILTQNTAWRNVEQAIDNLKQHNALNIHSIIQLSDDRLAEIIRPSGYFNIKTKRLKNFTHWFNESGGFNNLQKLTDLELRKSLLSVNGIGPETADDILLYAFERAVFVIDAYTRRLLTQLALINGNEPYETLSQLFESAIGTGERTADVKQFKEYHALIVRHAKEKCTHTNACKHCYIEKISYTKN